MRKDERDIIRQVLESVLRNLREVPAEGEPNSSSVQLFDNSPSSGISSYKAPVILVVSADLKASPRDTASQLSAGFGVTDRPETPNLGMSDHTETKLSHPGLERFIIGEATSAPSAPKACVMEPGRTCVKSGACEMRGF